MRRSIQLSRPGLPSTPSTRTPFLATPRSSIPTVKEKPASRRSPTELVVAPCVRGASETFVRHLRKWSRNCAAGTPCRIVRRTLFPTVITDAYALQSRNQEGRSKSTLARATLPNYHRLLWLG